MRIAAFGDINIDVILNVDRLPRLGEEVFSSHRIEILGGSASNTAVVLSRLGHRVAVMGAVGGDSAGVHALEMLQAIGISTELVLESPGLSTAMNTVLITPDGERTMIGARGANVSYRNVTGWESNLDWLHVSGYALLEGAQQESAIEAIRTSSEHGIRLSMDIPSGVGSRIRKTVGSYLGDFSVVAGSRLSLQEISGSDEPVEDLIARGVSRVAMTSGADPLVFVDGDEKIRLTPPRVNPIDATGAGDALIAGLIAATLGELGAGPSAVLGAASGAAATLVTGASQTLADPATWDALLRSELWSDAKTDWLTEVTDFVRHDTFSPGTE